MVAGSVKIGHKKMAAKGGRIDFIFLDPPPPPTWPLDPLLVPYHESHNTKTFIGEQ